MKDITINLRISKQLLDLIDNDRGLVPRSAYIRDLLEKKVLGRSVSTPAMKPPRPTANERAGNTANEARANAIKERINQGIASLNDAQKAEIISARYPKNEFRKAIGEIVSKDSIAKYWDEIELQLNAG